MGLLTRIFRSRDAPKNATAGSGYSFMLGSSASGKSVNERSAMQITAVYSCVRILSEAIASLPLHLYQYTDTGTAKATDHLLYFLLHDEPNPEMTSFVFRETLMTHLLLWGNAYAQIIRNGKGEVLALYPLMPDRMNVDVTKAETSCMNTWSVRKMHPSTAVLLSSCHQVRYCISQDWDLMGLSDILR